MADIAPVPTVQVGPALPVASAAPVAALPATASAPGAPQDFIGQLTAALKTLKGLAGAVTPAAPPATPAAADAPVAPAKDDSTSDAETPKPSTPDDILELLATLGLVPAPTLTLPQAPATGSTGAKVATSSPETPNTPHSTETAPGPAPTGPNATPDPGAAAATGTTAADTSTASTTDTNVTTPPTLTPPAVTDGLTTPGAPTAPASHVATPPASTPGSAPAPTHAAAPAQQPVAPAQAATIAAHEPAQPAQATLPPPTPHVSSQPVLTPQGSFQQGTDTSSDDDGQTQQHSTQKAAPLDATPTTDVTPAPDRMFTVAAAATAPANAPQAPVNVPAAQVATQIAQQVDLYRLPGNKGVRIQLHPDDLGGVQVTLRYASGGNLELHINVEHAATGALVQAGMPQLRDALASQGFHPDRLVMSVSAPAAAGQMDFSSNNNGSGRSDTSGMAAFTQNGQNQSSPQRNNDEGRDGPALQGWSTNAEVSTSTGDTTPGVVSSNSRIDYRV